MKNALLLIDIQKDYFPGGKMELVQPLEAAKVAYDLLQCFREHDLYHVHIQHVSTRPGRDVLPARRSRLRYARLGRPLRGRAAGRQAFPKLVPRDPTAGDATGRGYRASGDHRHDDAHVRGCDGASGGRPGLQGHRRGRRVRHARSDVRRDDHSGRSCAQGVPGGAALLWRGDARRIRSWPAWPRTASRNARSGDAGCPSARSRRANTPVCRGGCGWSTTLLSGAYAAHGLLLGWSVSRAHLVGVDSWPRLANPWLLVPAFVAVFGGVYLVVRSAPELLHRVTCCRIALASPRRR